MSEEREMIEVQLIPMNVEDKHVIAEAIQFLTALQRLLDPPLDHPWSGTQTIEGLNRIRDRIHEYGYSYSIPMPIGLRTKKPLFVQQPEEGP